MEKNNSIKYLAGAIFAVGTIVEIMTLIQSFYIWNLLAVIPMLIMAIACFASVPIMVLVGTVIQSLLVLRSIFMNVRMADYNDGAGLLVLANLMFLCWCILLLISSVIKKNEKIFGIIASVVSILRLVFLYVRCNQNDITTTWSFWIYGLVLTVGAILAGFALETMHKNVEVVNKNAISAAKNTESQAERLTKLKSLLDMGAISQEEFDKKKKEILDL